MKKLVIATLAAAAVGGAFAQTICDTLNNQIGESGESCRVYDFKASVKLVDGVRKKEKGGICDAQGYAYYRVAAKRTLKGVFFECNPCNATNRSAGVVGDPLLWGWKQDVADTVSGSHADITHFFISTSDSKYKVIASTETRNGNANPTAFYEFLLLNYFGSSNKDKATKAEGLLDIDFMEFDKYQEYRFWSILCAGFGAQSKGMLKNLSGNVAGAVSAARWCGIPTLVFEPCLLNPAFTAYTFADPNNPSPANFTGATPNADVPWATLILTDGADNMAVTTFQSYAQDAVSGTWSLKYNASKSRLHNFGTLISKTFGSGTQWIEDQQASAWAAFVDTPRNTGAAYPLLITRQY